MMRMREESRSGGGKKKTKKRLAEDKERHVEEGGDEEKGSRGRLCGWKNNSYPLFVVFTLLAMFRVKFKS